MPYKFQKQFKNSDQAGKFLNYLSQFLQDDPQSPFDLNLKKHLVKIESKKINQSLVDYIDKYFDQSKSSDQAVKLFCDGGSRGNPGPGAAGFVLLSDRDELLSEGGQFFDHCTNNQAEYQSLKLGIEEALSLQVASLQIFMDSQLIVKQVKGEYKIKNLDLKLIYKEIMSNLSKFENYSIDFVPRRYNQQADAMVNKILDENLDL